MVGYKERLPETEKGTEMTQYEVASLAVQYMGVWVAGSVGFAQCLLIGIGLLYMRRAAILRDRALDELIERTRSNHDEHMANHEAYMANHEENMANHEENMANHEENMASLRQRTERVRTNHEENMASLRTLIERTGGAGA